ncbi:MAG: alpha/beta hydrolase [Chitinophagaceae bacterium]|nr:alpha/beta hydrolase [Chitinophagaceae bacterium]
MKLYYLVLALALVTGLASCSKTDTAGNTVNIAAKTMLNEPYGTDPLQKLDIYLPANRSSGSTKVLVLIHGGGWTTGDKNDYATVLDTLKKRLPDYAIFNLNYRLASFPNNLFPTQEIDTKAAIDFINGNRGNYLVSDKFVLMGASAGAHLSLLNAYKYHSNVNVKACVDFFGPTDMVDMYNNPGAYPALSIAALLSGTPTTNPSMYAQSSPMTYVNAQSCPTIILQGGLDPLVNPTTQSLALKNKLTSFTITNEYVFYPLGGHGDWDAATFTDAYDKIQAFLLANVL